MNSHPGFTLTELLVALGIVASLVLMTMIVSSRTIKNSEFDRVRETIRTEITRAQADSLGGTFDSAWGVMFSATSVTRYRGSSYATRSPASDVVSSFGSITATGTKDLPFTRPKGLPSAAAAIVITNGTLTSTTTVNMAGAISIQ
jgi:prepilin-type N-terminal cleavage/methylation domain-containing protein